jgi:hypothetical protein
LGLKYTYVVAVAIYLVQANAKDTSRGGNHYTKLTSRDEKKHMKYPCTTYRRNFHLHIKNKLLPTNDHKISTLEYSEDIVTQ